MSIKKVVSAILLTAGLIGMPGVGFAQSLEGAIPTILQRQTVSSQDQAFIMQAGQANLAEVMASQLALQNSTNPDVRAMATKMVQDHAKANADLAPIAASLGMTLPTAPSPQQQAVVDQLSTLSGSEFDAAYLQHMTQAHQEAVALFRAASEQATSPELQSYASTYLPSLEMHLASLQQETLATQQPTTTDMRQPDATTGTSGVDELNTTPDVTTQSETGVQSQSSVTRQTTTTTQRQTTLSQPQGSSTVRGYW